MVGPAKSVAHVLVNWIDLLLAHTKNGLTRPDLSNFKVPPR